MMVMINYRGSNNYYFMIISILLIIQPIVQILHDKLYDTEPVFRARA